MGFFKTLADYASNLGFALLATLTVGVAGAVAWIIIDKLTKHDDLRTILIDRNWAYLAQRIGIQAGLTIAMLPTIASLGHEHPGWSWLWMATEVSWCIVAMLIARPIVDQLVLSKINNLDELLKGNLAVGIAEAGFYIGIGFVINGSLTGDAPSFWTLVASTAGFYVLGIALLGLAYKLYKRLSITGEVSKELTETSVATGIDVGAAMTAFGILIGAAVAGDFDKWWPSIGRTLATLIVGTVILLVVKFAIEHLLLKAKILDQAKRHQNIVASFLTAAVIVIAAFITQEALVTQI